MFIKFLNIVIYKQLVTHTYIHFSRNTMVILMHLSIYPSQAILGKGGVFTLFCTESAINIFS